MMLLAIETATRAVGCALWDDDGPLASYTLIAGPRHAEVLMPVVDQMCREAGVKAGSIEAVAVDNGPGLFTGLRVGLATAQAIAESRGLPAVGVSSLDALAHPERRRTGLLASVVDARRGEVFWALYRGDGSRLEQLRGPCVASPEELAGELGGLTASTAGPASPGPPATDVPARTASKVLAVGDGARRFRDLLTSAGVEVATPAQMWPSPLVVAELGWESLKRNGVPEGPPAPVYLRQADVRIGWEEVSGRVGAGSAGSAEVAPAEVAPGSAGAAAGSSGAAGAGPAGGSARLGT